MATLPRIFAAFFALTAAAPLFAQDARPPNEPGRTESLPDAPPVPTIDTSVPTMTFRLVEGRAFGGISRWVQASGRFVADTPAGFAALARTTNLRGMTVFLDSGGGNLPAGLALGRAFRAAGVNTAVGRTVTRMEGGQRVETLVTHDIGCHSACTYAFLGGVQRRVPTTVKIGVHQFSHHVDSRGQPVDAAFGLAEYRSAQEITSQLAVYVQEMGVDARLLEVAATAPFGVPIRILTNREIADLRFGQPTQVPQADRQPVGWSRYDRRDAPMLYRLVTRPGAGSRRVDEEMFISCGPSPDWFPTTVRAILARGERGDAVRATGVRVASGERVTTWRRRADEAPLQAQNPGESLFARFAVTRAVFEEARRTNRLDVALAPGATFEAPTAFGDGFGEAFAWLFQACADRARARSGR
jgi:hypothetical protein